VRWSREQDRWNRNGTGKHKRITAQEAAHLLETGERNARKILAAACRVLSMDYNGFTDYWELVDGDNG
jgi:hypothetical protein